MVMKEFSLDGKVAIVTGAGRGLGRVIALTMAEAGADIVCAGRTSAPLEATVRDVQGLGTHGAGHPHRRHPGGPGGSDGAISAGCVRSNRRAGE